MLQLPLKLIDDQSLLQGISYLTRRDSDLAKIVQQLGTPPLWSREPGFATLIHIILEQQVSLASAKAAFLKLEGAADQVTPRRFFEFSDEALKSFGFSRQKTRYGRLLATALLQNELNLETLQEQDDDTVRRELTKITGIGAWTANIYLLMALRRPDVLPVGDLALAKAIQEVKQLPARPDSAQLEKIALPWQPWRSVAVRILWHYYLR